MSNSSVGASRTGGRFARRRRGALRRALSIADVDGSGTIDRGEFLAALPLLRVGEAPSGPALDFIFADGEITFSSFLEMCVRVVDAHRVRRQCRDAVKKLLFIALVLLPAFTVAVSLVGGLVLYEVEGWAYVDCFYLVLSNLTSTHIPLAHDKHAEDRLGKLTACLVGLCSIGVFCCFLGILVGPLLEPIGERLRLAPKEVDRLDRLLGGGDDADNGMVGLSLSNWLPQSAKATLGDASAALGTAVGELRGLVGLGGARPPPPEKFELVIRDRGRGGARDAPDAAPAADVEAGRGAAPGAGADGDDDDDGHELECAAPDPTPPRRAAALAARLFDGAPGADAASRDAARLEVLRVAAAAAPPPAAADRADREGAALQWSITDDDLIEERARGTGDAPEPPPGYHLCSADCTS